MIIYFHFRSIRAEEENGRKKSAKAKPQKQNNYIIDSGVKMMIPFSNIFCILVPMVEIDVWCFWSRPIHSLQNSKSLAEKLHH